MNNIYFNSLSTKTHKQKGYHKALVLEKLKKDIESLEHIYKKIQHARKAIDDHNKDSVETLRALSKNGWYISGEASLFLIYRAVHEAQKKACCRKMLDILLLFSMAPEEPYIIRTSDSQEKIAPLGAKLALGLATL